MCKYIFTVRMDVCMVECVYAQINAIAFSGDYVATCSEDGSLRVWSNSDWEQTVQFQVVEKVRHRNVLDKQQS